MRKLGDAYNYGYGVAQNNNEAIKWYLRAIKQGDSLARSNLSMLYLSNGRKHSAGEGVPQDYTKALSWYRKSADLDNSAADIAIGEIFEHGKGVPRNLKSARLWYNRAVRDGREYALSALERVDPLAAAKAEAKFTDFDHDGIYPSGVPCARLGKEVDNFLACIEAAGKKVEIWANDGDLPTEYVMENVIGPPVVNGRTMIERETGKVRYSFGSGKLVDVSWQRSKADRDGVVALYEAISREYAAYYGRGEDDAEGLEAADSLGWNIVGMIWKRSAEGLNVSVHRASEKDVEAVTVSWYNKR